MAKTPTCRPGSEQRKQFLASPPLKLEFGGQTLYAAPREFSTGGVGYGATGKITVLIENMPVELQVSFNPAVIGSKPE